MTGTPLGRGSVLARRFVLDDLLDEFDGARFWRATDRTLARSVAVHVLPVSDPRSGSLLEAARTSALVSDGHLLRVLDAAQEDGVVYVVNEWGSGVSLDRLLAEGPLSPRRAAWVVKEVAEAVATAHRNDVAHGRLLPENVMISEVGSVKLVNFVIDAVLRTGAGRGQRRVTGGEPMDPHESDVVNLAALLYACLVGRWPGSEGSALPAAPTEHGRPLRPRRVRAGVARSLDAICERVLNPDAHPGTVPIGSAHEIYAALSDFIGAPAATGGGAGITGNTGELATVTPDTAPDDTGGGDQHDEQHDEQQDGGERTALLDRAALARQHQDRDEDQHEVPAPDPATAGRGTDLAVGTSSTTDDTDDLDDTGDTGDTGDLEATQAGTPVFEDDTGPSVGEPGPSWSWPPAEEPPTARAHPPVLPPPPPPRPLFADDPAVTGRPDATAAGMGAPGRDSVRGPGADPAHPRDDGPPTDRTDGHGRDAWAKDRPAERTDGGGTVPPGWGPYDRPGRDDYEDGHGDGYRDDPWDEDPAPLPGRTWLRLGVLVAVVLALVLVGVLGFDALRGSGSPGADPSPTHPPSSSASPRSVAVPIAGVSDFDPEGDPPEENPDLAPLAVDGKPGTAWQTLTYRGNPRLGGLKSGVGLLVDLGKPARIGRVRLSLLGQGTSLQLLAAPGATTAPTSTDGLRKVATATDAGTSVRLRLASPVRTRWFVVWLTSLPPTAGGFKGQVAEISVRS